MLIKTLMKSDKKQQSKIQSNKSVVKTNTKGNIDVKAKNRKSQ